MPKYCCFWCPKPSFDERTLEDVCSSCGRTYGTPLRDYPAFVGNLRIEGPIARGFYAVVYKALDPDLSVMRAVRVVPKALYSFFGKEWHEELRAHAALHGSPHIANVIAGGEEVLSFASTEVDCHYAVMEFVDGRILESVLSEPRLLPLTLRAAAQIAVDLFEILHLFAASNRFHNDLNDANLIVASLATRNARADAFEPRLRVVAIDLGSMLGESLSGDHHLGDQQHIARHLAQLAAAALSISDRPSDEDYRIAEALRGLSQHLSPRATSQRVISVDDARHALEDALRGIDRPWSKPLSLQQFSDAYNAQSLESWHVPELWVDPDGRWLARTQQRGPQIITGMRGCGKTMLLRALHFHARASDASRKSRQPLEMLSLDPVVGLYASCLRLLSPQDNGVGADFLPFERLYLAYCKDALAVLRHAGSLAPDAMTAAPERTVTQAFTALRFRDDVTPPTSEGGITDLLFRLSDGDPVCRLQGPPAEAFSYLADRIRASCSLFAEKYVLFLLDDVSTRFVPDTVIREVISRLLFQHPSCAFRISTEAQTLHRLVLSPGGITAASPSRDYDEFDLGHEVYRHLSTTEAGSGFIERLLIQRGLFSRDPIFKKRPRDVLGDVPLLQVAREIARAPDAARDRKIAYRGLSCLEAVCVGDLGDVVKLYQNIALRAAPHEQLPVPSEDQSAAFLEYSAGLLHGLNRRDARQKAIALAFAQAAGELLSRSGRKAGSTRLRQYSKLYVRIDKDATPERITRALLELLDAGVFVLDGGVPRTKTKDDDPVLQFKLSYRKLLGLASFIGLSNRDRFELSGDNLRRFLEEPSSAKSVLLENQVAEEDALPDPEPIAVRPTQLTLDIPVDESILKVEEAASVASHAWPDTKISGRELELESWSSSGGLTLVLARGAEERTAVSATRVLARLNIEHAIVVDYAVPGQGDDVMDVLRRRGVNTCHVTSITDLSSAIAKSDGAIVIDSSGLAKQFLFVAVRDALRKESKARIVHTLAEEYYPSNAELEARGIRPDLNLQGDDYLNLPGLLLGEVGPYSLVNVYRGPPAPERPRVLLCSASAKNDRLQFLLGERQFDAVRIFAPPPTTSRRRVARAAAELAASVADVNTEIVEIETNDFHNALAHAIEIYRIAYYGLGATIEIGLTGSKMHTVAFAAVAAVAPISQVWYIQPAKVDLSRFTRGVSRTNALEVSL